MARFSVVLALFAVLAVAFAQNQEIIDDFVAAIPPNAANLRISTFDTTTVTDFSCDANNGGTQGTILGGCHVMYLTGFANSGCEPTGAIASGNMFCNNAFNCAAECVLQLDGSDTTQQVTGGLNVNLNSLGFAFRIFAATDVATTFTVRVIDTSGNVSRASGSIPANSSSTGLVQYDFNFSGDFSGSASFSSVGTLEIAVPDKLDTDVVLTDWTILSNEADISGSVFVDCDCDNNKDADDVGIGSVTVTLQGDSQCVVDTRTTTTSSSGAYTFVGLPPCTYTVTVPSSIGNLCSSSSNPRTVQLGGTSVFNVNFGTDVPSSFSVPSGATVFCNAGRSPAQLGEASSSQCGASGSVSFSDSISDQRCDAEFTIIRTWTDSFGASGTQTIFVQDTGVAPTFTNANAQNLDIVVSCNGCVDAGSCVPALTATDDCSAVVVNFSDGPLSSTCDTSSCTNELRFTRTWTAVDDCGNQAPNQAQVIFEDCEVGVCPSFTPVPIASFAPVASAAPVTNPPTRNCRFICDDDDSAASSVVASLLVVVLALVALF